ncbi:sigma 54-interacting transcriptional regulator [Clostridium sp. CX1]|nr:sigma 54-interacting transcriptional regulator [Clostridium sp. CX1]MCT8976729.1 sigma 54-interacting transcriptional regulator [Clostridium sp. CX1]
MLIGILTSDLKGNIKTVNKYAPKLFGYEEDELKNMNIADLIQDHLNLDSITRSKKGFDSKDVFVNSKRNKLQFNLSIHPIFIEEEAISKLVYVFLETKKERRQAHKIVSGKAIYTFDKVIGKNKRLIEIIKYCKKISDSKSTILITGESGTGKEIFAQSIHNHSDRKDEAFVAVNCGAIPQNLIESELFGYEEGAFTGAKKGGYAGKFEMADKGTLFLDEIGEMPLDMQTKLLRVIEEGVINRIGTSKQIPVNIRIIAATNKDLKSEAEEGNFRKDLYYRLNVLPVHLPPLRERKDDIPLLMEFFMKKISKHLNKRIIKIGDSQMKYFLHYNWPGNIRELENLVELMINTESVPIELLKSSKDIDLDLQEEYPEQLKLDYAQREHIIKVLYKFNGSITAAAKALGIGRNTLYRKIDNYSIDCSILEQSSKMEQS